MRPRQLRSQWRFLEKLMVKKAGKSLTIFLQILNRMKFSPPDPPEGGIGGIFGHVTMRKRSKWRAKVHLFASCKAKIGTLMAEAKTLPHLCIHRYRNPHGEACIRAKMKHFRAVRGAFQRELKS